MIAAVFRYYEIRSIGLAKTVIFSRLYRGKLYAQWLQAVIEVLIILFYFIWIEDNDETREASHYIYQQREWSLFLLINFFAWIIGISLMAFEYRKRLSEAFYTHWFYWTVMWVDSLVFLIFM